MSKDKTLFINRPLAFNVMLKPIGPVCNLNCTYCYYLEKKQIYQNTTNFKMHDNVLEKYIEDYIMAQQVPVVSFVWQGGEPTLLGLDYFKKVLELQDKYSQNKRIENVFQTNGTLLNDDWCKFFKDNNFLIGVSIDGPEHLHDYHRTYTAGNKPSHKDVMRGIKLLQKYSVEFNTLSVVNKYNSKSPIEVYNFLKDIGSQYLQFIPIVERVANNPVSGELELVSPSYGDDAYVTDWSVGSEEYGRFLISIFDEWVRKDVGKTFVQMFDVALANWAGERPGLCVFSETCGDAAVMEHNGDLYTCDHFVYPEYFMGNIMEKPLVGMVVSDRQIKFGSDKRDKLPPYCIDCEYRFACNGECPKHRFTYTPEGDPGLNYLCSSYKLFFKHVHPYMQYMNDQLTKKKAPANVMEWVRKIDNRQTGKPEEPPKLEIGRNDPCPCGSGKKFKNCCINIVKY